MKKSKKSLSYTLIPILVAGQGTKMAMVDDDVLEDLSWKQFRITYSGRAGLAHMPHGLGSIGERLYGTKFRNARHYPIEHPFDLRRETFTPSKVRLSLMKG